MAIPSILLTGGLPMKKKKVSGAHPKSPLQQARIKAGLTQEYLAEILDCGTRSVQGYEAGRCDPPLAKLRKMMSLYECEFADLYPDSADAKPPPSELANGGNLKRTSVFAQQFWCVSLCSAGYRQKMPITEIMVFHTHFGETGFYVCPRCKLTLDRDFVSFCDRCGQHLDWKDYRKAKLIYPGRK